jgi:hypothetical protein
MTKYVRVVAVPTVENHKVSPLYLDIVIDQDCHIMGNHDLFGFQGDISSRSSGTSFPFILDPNGKVDFGDEYKSPDRYAELDIRDGKVSSGRLLSLRGHGYDHKFRISQVSALAEN